MYVKFKSFGLLRRIIGDKVIDVEVTYPAIIKDVIEAVIVRFGKRVEDLVYDNGKISGNLIILLNMKDVSNIDGVMSTVSEGDEVTMLPHVQGGC